MAQIVAEFEIDVERYHMLHRRMGRENPILKYMGTVELRQFKDSRPDLYLHVIMLCLDRGLSSKDPVNVYKQFVFEQEDCDDIVEALTLMITECYERIRLYGKNN